MLCNKERVYRYPVDLFGMKFDPGSRTDKVNRVDPESIPQLSIDHLQKWYLLISGLMCLYKIQRNTVQTIVGQSILFNVPVRVQFPTSLYYTGGIPIPSLIQHIKLMFHYFLTLVIKSDGVRQ